MIHLVLDTNVYRKNSKLNTTDFRTLAKLVNQRCLELHVPYIVEREFSTYLEQQQRQNVKDLTRSLSKILHFQIPSSFSDDLRKFIQLTNDNVDSISGEPAVAYENWLVQINAVRHPITQEQSQNALEAYFNGGPPLKHPKVRKDIPDSLIFQQILHLKDACSSLCVIAEDKALKAACEQASIECYLDTESFFGSATIKECLLQIKNKEEEDDTKDFGRKFVHQNLSKITEVLEEALLSSDNSVLSGESIPGENQEIYISGVYTPQDIEIDNIEIEEDAFIWIDVSARVELTYEYPVWIHDAYDMVPPKFYISPLNDHYHEVETTDTFKFRATIELDYSDTNSLSKSIVQQNTLLKDPTISVINLWEFEVVDESEY